MGDNIQALIACNRDLKNGIARSVKE